MDMDACPSPTMQNTELKPLLSALGVAMTDAELKVASASIDADGSGDIRFSEFYGWFTGTNGGGGGGYGGGCGDYGNVVGDSVMMSDAESRGQHSYRTAASATPSGRSRLDMAPSPIRRPAGMKGRLRNAAGGTFVKVHATCK